MLRRVIIALGIMAVAIMWVMLFNDYQLSVSRLIICVLSMLTIVIMQSVQDYFRNRNKPPGRRKPAMPDFLFYGQMILAAYLMSQAVWLSQPTEDLNNVMTGIFVFVAVLVTLIAIGSMRKPRPGNRS